MDNKKIEIQNVQKKKEKRKKNHPPRKMMFMINKNINLFYTKIQIRIFDS